MAGFTIHLAVGVQYIEKHKNEIENEQEFIKGVIAPDLNEKMTDIEKDKSKSHYGKWGNYNYFIDFNKFLDTKTIDIKKDYFKGYFLHLLTDYYFYNIDFHNESTRIMKCKDTFYHDYDCLNEKLIKKYSKIDKYEFNSIKKYMKTLKEEPEYLKLNKIIDFIEKISDFDIESEVKIIKEKGMEGLK